MTFLICFQIMIPAATVVPCSSKLQTAVDVNSLIQQGLIRHPCKIRIYVVYKDDPPITACDITATRTWTLSDNCNQVHTFQQLVKVLPVLKPLSPSDGEVNVRLTKTLRWPKYRNSFKYHVYLWKNGENRRKVAEVSNNFYTTNGQKYNPPNSQMLWQIEFKMREGYLISNQSIIPSPIWSFKTIQIIDFSVVAVNSPEILFTGQTMQISWTVENKGSRRNFQPNWYDCAFLSRDIDITDMLVSRVDINFSKIIRINRYIFPGDSYTANAMISIPNNLNGTLYAHVIIDYYNYFNELNRTNNHGVNLQPLIIKLTTPPDLQVDQIVTPERTFSGKCIMGYIFVFQLLFPRYKKIV